MVQTDAHSVKLLPVPNSPVSSHLFRSIELAVVVRSALPQHEQSLPRWLASRLDEGLRFGNLRQDWGFGNSNGALRKKLRLH